MARRSPVAAALFALLVASGTGAAAQELQAAALGKSVDEAGLTVDVATPLPAATTVVPAVPRRPALLMPLYVSFGALQVFDTMSTLDAVGRGGAEANPMMRGIAAHPLALAAVKAAGTTGVIFVTEKMWRRNKPAAVVFMLAANGAMAFIVNNNYRAAR